MRTVFSPIERSWHSCQKSFDGVHKSSVPASVLCSFAHVCYTRSILLWLLQLCSKVWNKEISMNLATLYYFPGLFWLSGSLEIPLEVLRWIFLFVQKVSLGFQWSSICFCLIFSLSIMPSSFIHVVANDKIAFIFLTE